MSLQSIEATMIMGMGNIAGPGMSLIDHFEDTARRARSNTPASEESESSSRTRQLLNPRSRQHEMEWIAVSIGVGLIVSLLFTEVFGLTVGGMIVPGYLALYLGHPATVVLTFVAAFITWGCVVSLNRWAILFGRRRVVITMVVGFAIASMILRGSGLLHRRHDVCTGR